MKQRKGASSSPYNKRPKKKDPIYDGNPLRKSDPLLAFESKFNSRDRLFAVLPGATKLQNEITRLKAFHGGPIRPQTEGKKRIKPDFKIENGTKKKKPHFANQRPASPGISKSNSKNSYLL